MSFKELCRLHALLNTTYCSVYSIDLSFIQVFLAFMKVN